ncbi:hypothetical protein BDA96_07G150700 [Sorghum bicolor]|nr:hypothetical protein BDA96_07G150700 [Sorghum bicolor]
MLMARSLGRGGGSAAATTRPTTGGLGKGAATAPSSINGSSFGAFPSSSSSMDGFPFPPSPSLALWDAAGDDPSSPGFASWDKDPRPPGGFMNYFNNQPHNFHLVGAPIHNKPVSANTEASSPPEVEIMLPQPYNDEENIRIERRILWTEDEDVRLMSAWIEHSTDSTCGADKGDLFECAYVKARRLFTSGYSDQMWIDATHKFYVADNKDAKLGPFAGIEVWKICRKVTKWKTYNEELKNARKRKSFHLEGDKEENDEILEEMPKRPMGQKAAKKAALVAKKQSKQPSSDEDGNSKESAIDIDKFDRFSKF